MFTQLKNTVKFSDTDDMEALWENDRYQVKIEKLPTTLDDSNMFDAFEDIDLERELHILVNRAKRRGSEVKAYLNEICDYQWNPSSKDYDFVEFNRYEIQDNFSDWDTGEFDHFDGRGRVLKPKMISSMFRFTASKKEGA